MMDVNEYMRISLELQQQTVQHLAEISAKLGGTETVTLLVDAKEAVAAIAQAADEVKGDASKGSSKQASNHAKDDAKQEQEQAAKSEEKPKTADDVRAALMDFGKREGSEAAIALLKKYDATSVSSLSKDDYAAIIADAKA